MIRPPKCIVTVWDAKFYVRILNGYGKKQYEMIKISWYHAIIREVQ